MPLKLWLVRHGQTTINAGLWNNQPTEVSLTELGEEQARAVAKQVTEQPDILIVSPLKRAQQTAQFILEHWPNTPVETWPIQEFLYLSPQIMQDLDEVKRKETIASYWQEGNYLSCHGDSAESFSDFLKRVSDFQERLKTLQNFAIVIGHGQFFKAYQLGLKYGLTPSADWMRRFREQEIANPLKNGEIAKLDI